MFYEQLRAGSGRKKMFQQSIGNWFPPEYFASNELKQTIHIPRCTSGKR
jgi:hypothetical protein